MSRGGWARPAPEAVIQRTLAQRLDLAKLVWCHVPNGGSRGSIVEAVNLRRAGVKGGVPDVLIFTPTKQAPHGVALELKADKGVLSDAQREWLDSLRAIGWAAIVAYGLDDAVAQLRALGYRV